MDRPCRTLRRTGHRLPDRHAARSRSTGPGRRSGSPTARRSPTTGCCWRRARCRGNCRSRPMQARAASPCAASTMRSPSAGCSRPACGLSSSAAASSGSSLRQAPRKRGAAVTVIEAQPRVLMRGVPEEIAFGRGRAASCRGRRHPHRRRHRVDLRRCRCGARRARRRTADRRPTSWSSASAPCPVTGLAEAAGLAVENGIAVDRLSQDQRSGHLCRRRLLLVPARNLWRAAGAAGILAQRAGPGHACGEEHARRRRAGLGGAVVLVGSARPHPADRGACRRGPSGTSAATSATAPSSCSTSRRTDGCLPPAASGRAMRSRATSGSPRC